MADQESVLSAVLYYAREGWYYRHMQTAMVDLLIRFGSDPILLFWKAFAMILEDRLVEGMRELDIIKDSPDLILGAPLLLIHAHRQCKTIDKEAIQQLEAAVKKDRKSCSNKAFYYASMVFWLTGRHDRAREYLDKCLKTSPSAKAMALRGWIDLTSGKDEYVKKSIKYFDEACNSDSTPPLNAVLGKVHYHTSSYLYMQALDIINSALVNSPSCLPLYLEKMRIQLALQEWDVAIETAQRCIALDSTCIKATQVMALEQCIRHGNMDEVSSILGKLIEQLDQSEPQSHQLYLISAQAFSRLSGGHRLILQQAHTLLERAINLCPSSPTYIVELAYQYLLSGNVQEAMSTYRKALSLSDSNMSALLGVVHCKLKLKKTKEAEQQIEFLNELQGSAKTPELFYLDALTTHQKGKDSGRVIKLINEAIKMHFDSVKGYPLSLEYFYHLNPEFIMSMAQILMTYAPSEPPALMGQSLGLLHDVGTAIDPLVHSAPGLLHVRLLLARVKYLSGDTDSALSMAQFCIDGGHCVIEALLLQAVIHLQRGNYKQCDQILESALSYSFEVQQYPLYQLVKGQQQYISGLVKESIKTLQSALSLKKSSSGDLLPPPTASQWVSGHLTLAQALTKLSQEHEATKIMQDCVIEFTGTPEEARVTIANAELLLSRGNSTEALSMLRKVTEDKIYYIQAMERMAEIYLTYQKNKQKYIQCYQELAEKLPGPPTALLLGDALIAIQEPEQALQIYERALKKNPSDGVLASKVGQTYIRTHNYTKAVSYYEASLKSIDHPGLRCDLALLYMRLNRFDQAERILSLALDQRRRGQNQWIDDGKNAGWIENGQMDGNGQIGVTFSFLGEDDNIHSMRDNVRYCQLLTKLYCKTKRFDDAISILERGRGIQVKILKRVSVEEPDAVQREKELLSTLLHQLADEISRSDPQNARKAEPYYKEAAESCPENSMFRESLARWYMSCGQLEECEQECMTLLRTNPGNDVATGILAELSFAKGKIDDSVQTLEELLTRKPTYYEGLARLIDLLRRAGNLEKAESYIKLAEGRTVRSGYEAGLNYCKGLYHRYKGESDKALLHFNRARRDSDWGEKVVFSMIEICLNSDDILGAESLKSSDSDISIGGTISEKLESELMAANTAEKLLREIHPSTPAGILKVKVIENYVLMVTRTKQNAEKALGNFTEMPPHDRESIPSLVGMAMAYLILKQVPRARNHLKRLGKTPWVAQYADEIEKGWILLADLYIQTGKYDLAIEQLKKCLQYNKSCSKAYEYLGFIAEKEQAYGDAANHYKSAWISGHMTNPAVGYRLAFNHLKGRHYLSAVDVCHEVLEKYPTYPRIRKEILEKARQCIRI